LLQTEQKLIIIIVKNQIVFA